MGIPRRQNTPFVADGVRAIELPSANRARCANAWPFWRPLRASGAHPTAPGKRSLEETFDRIEGHLETILFKLMAHPGTRRVCRFHISQRQGNMGRSRGGGPSGVRRLLPGQSSHACGAPRRVARGRYEPAATGGRCRRWAANSQRPAWPQSCPGVR